MRLIFLVLVAICIGSCNGIWGVSCEDEPTFPIFTGSGLVESTVALDVSRVGVMAYVYEVEATREEVLAYYEAQARCSTTEERTACVSKSDPYGTYTAYINIEDETSDLYRYKVEVGWDKLCN